MTITVLHVIETLGHGGAEHQLLLATSHLPKSFRSVVCYLRGPSYLVPRFAAAGVEVVCLDAPRGKANWPRVVQALRHVIRSRGVDLVHTSLFEADLLAGAAAAWCRVPCVATLCNIAGEKVRLQDNPRAKRWKFEMANRLWAASLRYNHDHCIAISQAVAESAARTFGLPLARQTVVYRAIPQEVADDAELDARAVLLRAELGADFPLILNVGRLAPQKGQRYLVEAVAALTQDFPRAKLLIVGEGWLESELRAVARRHGIEQSVQFLGKREDVPVLLRAVDVFAFPSIFEGLGVVALQAAAAGACCVVSDAGPLREIFEDERSALIVPAGNALALGTALRRVISDAGLRERLGRAARIDVRGRFSIDSMIDGTQRVYGNVLGARRRSAGRRVPTAENPW